MKKTENLHLNKSLALALVTFAGLWLFTWSADTKITRAVRMAQENAAKQTEHTLDVILRSVAKSDRSAAVKVSDTGEVLYANELARSRLGIEVGDDFHEMFRQMDGAFLEQHQQLFCHFIESGETRVRKIECAFVSEGNERHRVIVDTWNYPGGAMAFVSFPEPHADP